MFRKFFIAITLLSGAFIFVNQNQAQSRLKAKTRTTNQAHDRYANQEVSYRQSNGKPGTKSRKTTTKIWGDPHVNERSSAPRTSSRSTSTKNPNATRKAQNILPYIEQDNVYKTAQPKRPNRAANRQ